MHCLSQHVRRLPTEARTAPSWNRRWLDCAPCFACLLPAGFVALFAPRAADMFASLGIGQPVLGFVPAAIAALMLAVGGAAAGFRARTTKATRIGFALSAAGLVIDVVLVVSFYWVVLHPDYYMGM